jgi:hypothetical protein
MPIILRLESVVESQLQDFGPAELVSVLAEVVVAACLFAPLVVGVTLTSWLLKRAAGYRAAELQRHPLH